MKKLIALLLGVSALLPAVEAQNDYLRASQIGISFFLNDYNTADRIRSSSLSSVLNNKQWSKLGEMKPGIALHFFRGIKNNIDFAGTVAFSIEKEALPNRPVFTQDALFIEADASAQFKMFSDKYWLQPYLSAGVGAQKYKSYYGAFVPVGVGLKINFFNEADLFFNSQYRVPVTPETSRYRFFNNVGVAGNVGKKRIQPVKTVPIPVVPKDTDGDGIIDDNDKCPDVKGVEKYQGCPVPDTDKDGLNDDEDKCPTVAGLQKYQGCPVPDTDKDGINDEEDKCPSVSGVARYEGCPVPDTDKDGINDEEDKCPTVPGIAAQQGCPEIAQEVVEKVAYASRNIYFNTGSAKLLSKSFAPLNEVVKILQENPDLKLSIEGHTDNTGSADRNQQLSEERAAAVKAYFAGKGIAASRLSSAGYGQEKPVADNKTAAGRQQNRRVELKLGY